MSRLSHFLYNEKVTWYKKALKNNTKEIFSSLPLYIITVVLLSIWHFLSGGQFTWVWIEPIEVPSVFVRIFYSALTLITIGAFLYKIRFYQFLWFVLGDWRTFKEAKALLWLLLMWFMYSWAVPKVIDLLNSVASIGYNIFNFLLYAFPAFVLSALILTGLLYLRKKDPTHIHKIQ